MNLYSEIAKLVGLTLRTLDQRKAFDVVAVESRSVTVRPHYRSKDRPIHIREIEGAFAELMRCGEITRVAIQAHHSSRNPAYVAALLAQLPGVTATTKPIQLRYTRPAS